MITELEDRADVKVVARVARNREAKICAGKECLLCLS